MLGLLFTLQPLEQRPACHRKYHLLPASCCKSHGVPTNRCVSWPCCHEVGWTHRRAPVRWQVQAERPRSEAQTQDRRPLAQFQAQVAGEFSGALPAMTIRCAGHVWSPVPVCCGRGQSGWSKLDCGQSNSGHAVRHASPPTTSSHQHIIAHKWREAALWPVSFSSH